MTQNISSITAMLNGTHYSFGATSLTLQEGYNVVYLTSSGYQVTQGPVQRSATTLPLWGLTVVSGKLQGSSDLRGQGGPILNAVDPNSGNLLASDFPGQTVHQTTGTYAGWEKMTATKTVGGGTALSVCDITGAPLGSTMLWAEWTAVMTTTANGCGPCFYDFNGTGFLAVDIYAGGGNIFTTQGAGQVSTAGPALAPNNVNNGLPHTFRLGVQYVSGSDPTALWRMIAYVDGVKLFDGNVIANFNNAEAYAGFRADPSSTVYIRDFKFFVGTDAYEMANPTITGLLGNDGSNQQTTKGQNLVFNGDFSLYTPPTGAKSTYASAIRVNDVNYQGTQEITPNGWTRNFETEGAGDGILEQLSGSGIYQTPYLLLLQDKTSGGNCGFSAVSDAFPVIGGRGYYFSAYMLPGFGAWAAGASWYMRVLFYKAGTTDFSRNSATLCTGTATATLSQNPGGATSANGTATVDLVKGCTSQTQGTYGGIITAPSDAAYARIAFYHWGATTAVWNLGVADVKFYEVAQNSTFLNQQGSITNVGGVPATLPYSSTASSITLNLPGCTLRYADQSSQPVPAPTTAPSWSSGLTASTTYYVLVGINTNTMQYVAYLSAANTQFSGTQIIQYIGGDGFIPIYTNASVSTAATGSTGGGIGGGGSGIKGCPAAWQIVETRERGFIRADEIDIGDHIRGKNGWKRVNEATLRYAPLYRYTLRDADRVEPFDVNDKHRLKTNSGEWVTVDSLIVGTILVDGAKVVAVEPLGVGPFVPLDVEDHEFMLGSSVCHNGLSY